MCGVELCVGYLLCIRGAFTCSCDYVYMYDTYLAYYVGPVNSYSNLTVYLLT